MMKADEWKKILKKDMSEKRYQHSCNVADMASELAGINGYDKEKAYLAGLLHDIAKEKSREKQFEYINKSGYDISEEEMMTQKLWHAIAGAYILREKYAIEEKDFLNAVRYHTVARAGMSVLEEIIYVADMISADRTLPCVHAIRALAQKDLKLAVLAELQYSIPSTIEKGGVIPPTTLEAYNYYVRFLNIKI